MARVLSGGSTATTTSTSSSRSNKIKIKAFRKPPKLPPNYYEETSQTLLQTTRVLLKALLAESSSSSALMTSTVAVEKGAATKSTAGTPTTNLQQSHQHIVSLVKHQFAQRLYDDLVLELQRACQEDLVPETTAMAMMTTGATSDDSDVRLLKWMSQQFNIYVDYLCWLRQLYSGLDRPYVYHFASSLENNNSKRGSALAASAATTSARVQAVVTKRSSPQQSTLLEVGLAVFCQRMLELKLDEHLYQAWWRTLWKDWKRGGTTAGGILSPATQPQRRNNNAEDAMDIDQPDSELNAATTSSTLDDYEDNIVLLQQTMALWQDVGWKYKVVLEQLGPDLERALKEECAESMSVTPTRFQPESYCQYLWHQWHVVVSYRWSTFLPKSWCRRWVEVCLLEPHLVPDFLLQPRMDFRNTKHFTTLITLASRLENGTERVVDAVVLQAKHMGLGITRKVTGPGGSSSANIPPPSMNNAVVKSMVTELLDLQERLMNLSKAAAASGASSNIASGEVDGVAISPRKESPTKSGGTNNTSGSSSSSGSNTSVSIPLKTIFTEVLNNIDTNRVAEALAKFMDMTLRMAHKVTPPLDAILQLFSHLHAKDIFEAFYKKDLAKRLLSSNKIASMDLERQFVSMLKVECGANYTSKMEGMFQDVEWSKEIMGLYKTSSNYKNVSSAVSATAATMATSDATDSGTAAPKSAKHVDMEVQILTTGYWPSNTQYPHLVLPPELLAHQEAFWDYYKAKYQGRKIVWQYAIGGCIVKFHVPSESGGSVKQYDLLVSLVPALVLLTMNKTPPDNSSGWTLPALMKALGLEGKRDEMETVLQSLSLGKDGTRVLTRVHHGEVPNNKGTTEGQGSLSAPSKPPLTISDKDVFIINRGFKSKQRRVKISNIVLKQQDAAAAAARERKNVVQGVSRDRLYLMDAVLVRIMKARKTMTHNDLIGQVLQQLKVPAQAADIKKRIESLIEREYMERDEKDRTRYNYLA